MAFDVLPAVHHDLTAIHELTVGLPTGATVFGDKAFISDPDAQSFLQAIGVRLVSVRRTNMTPNIWADDYDLRLYRKHIETVYCQLKSMGLQRLHARTNLVDLQSGYVYHFQKSRGKQHVFSQLSLGLYYIELLRVIMPSFYILKKYKCNIAKYKRPLTPNCIVKVSNRYFLVNLAYNGQKNILKN